MVTDGGTVTAPNIDSCYSILGGQASFGITYCDYKLAYILHSSIELEHKGPCFIELPECRYHIVIRTVHMMASLSLANSPSPKHEKKPHTIPPCSSLIVVMMHCSRYNCPNPNLTLRLEHCEVQHVIP
jgi:hypothetical protein